MRALFFLFIVMPILEMFVLIRVGGLIGALPTVGLVLLTAMVGVALIRRQGLSTIIRAQQRAQSGQIPLSEMAEGVFLAVGGALLLTPGFITDAIGFSCLIPGLRQLVIAKCMSMLRPINIRPDGPESGAQSHQTIEGEYKREK